MHNSSGSPLTLFYCYVDKDRSFCEEFNKHLNVLRYVGDIGDWQSLMLDPEYISGQDVIDYLASAQIILLLVSPDFLVSYIYFAKVMKHIFKRCEAGEAFVIPVIVRHAAWQDMPFGNVQVLPMNACPLESWLDPDAFFISVIDGIRQTILLMKSRQEEIGMNKYDDSHHSDPIKNTYVPDRQNLNVIMEEKVSQEKVKKEEIQEKKIGENKNKKSEIPVSEIEGVSGQGKYVNHAHEINIVVQGDNRGTIHQQHGASASDLAGIVKELLRGNTKGE